MAANISPVFSSTSSSVPSSKLCLDIFFSLWCRSKILVQWSLVLLERYNMMDTILVPASLTSNFVQKSLTSITLKAGGLKLWKSLESPVSHNRPKSKIPGKRFFTCIFLNPVFHESYKSPPIHISLLPSKTAHEGLSMALVHQALQLQYLGLQCSDEHQSFRTCSYGLWYRRHKIEWIIPATCKLEPERYQKQSPRSRQKKINK